MHLDIDSICDAVEMYLSFSNPMSSEEMRRAEYDSIMLRIQTAKLSYLAELVALWRESTSLPSTPLVWTSPVTGCPLAVVDF